MQLEAIMLMIKIYEAKRAYYSGNPLIDDYEYDALEAEFLKKYGRQDFEDWYCCGYDDEKHNELMIMLSMETIRQKPLSAGRIIDAQQEELDRFRNKGWDKRVKVDIEE